MTNLKKKLQILGIDVPYSFGPEFFASIVTEQTSPHRTLREFKMMAVMNAMTDERDWEKKVFDDKITKKWKKEAIEADQAVTEAMVDWCIEELRYRSGSFEATGIMAVYAADVVKSDTAVPEDLRTALRSAVQPLEDVPAAEKDWHPGSEGKVLDLVQPSLFPLVHRLSRILTRSVTNIDDFINRCGEGKTSPYALYCSGPAYEVLDYSYNWEFQWLPCDVDISSNLPKITSYINNLHPHRHKDLYSIIEKIIGCAIPLWNAALAPQRIPINRTRIPVQELKTPEEPPHQKGESHEHHMDRVAHWLEEAEIEQPEVGPFAPERLDYHLWKEDDEFISGSRDPKEVVDLKRDYADSGLQIIVKLANIHLTPEKPEYEGDSWHAEGQLNEKICATAIYYYDSDNISRSSLEFRHTVEPDHFYPIPFRYQYDKWLTDIFGLDNKEGAIQYIGSVDTREGRLLAFPNTVQHKTPPFKLTDPTKPGHQKLLALFLVDPDIKIISTAKVPCQRLDWWREALEAKKVLERLPLEVKDLVYDQVEGFPISMQTAKEFRLELVEARERYTSGFCRTREKLRYLPLH